MKACNYIPTEFEAKFKYHGLRCLDMTDLYIIVQIYKGKQLQDISQEIGINPSAITHRLNRKIGYLGDIIYREKGAAKLTKEGEYWAKKFISVFKVFEG